MPSTGRMFWIYQYKVSPGCPRRAAAVSTAAWRFSATRCSWAPSTPIWWRSTPRTGTSIWDVALAEPKQGYAITLAPLVVKDKVIIGTAGGEQGIRRLHRRL